MRTRITWAIVLGLTMLGAQSYGATPAEQATDAGTMVAASHAGTHKDHPKKKKKDDGGKTQDKPKKPKKGDGKKPE